MSISQHDRTSPHARTLCDTLLTGLTERGDGFEKKHTANWCCFSFAGRDANFAYARHAKNHIVVFLHRDLVEWKERLDSIGIDVQTRDGKPWQKVTPYYFTLRTREQALAASMAFFQELDGLQLLKEIAEREYFEGATRRVTINAYERDRAARQACLDHFTPVCIVCGVSLASIYGSVADGFIHVHHLKSVAAAKGKYKLNPIEDLRPVCPNCHAIIHLRKPPYSIEEVRAFLNQKRNRGVK